MELVSYLCQVLELVLKSVTLFNFEMCASGVACRRYCLVSQAMTVVKNMAHIWRQKTV